MKKIVSFIFLLSAINIGHAQSAAAIQLSDKIAQKMKDSLVITESQKVQIYNINMLLLSQKLNLRKQYTSVDTLTAYTQKIENARDSLYHTVLSEDKYLLYKQKKKNLINNN